VAGWYSAGETLFENSNVRAPDSAGILINDPKTGENYTYKALLLSGDDDGIGLVFLLAQRRLTW